MSSEHIPVVVVMVPLPAQGHLNQLLHLSHLLSAFHIPVHFVGAATHNRQARRRHTDSGPTPEPIQFHDFDIPSFHSPPPDPAAANKFPSHLIPSFRAAAVHLQRPLATFFRMMASKAKRVVVIHDSLMSSAVEGVRGIGNAESYSFHSISVFSIAVHSLELEGKGNGNGKEYFPNELKVPEMEACFPVEFMEYIKWQFGRLSELGGSGKIYNSCRIIEGNFLHLIQNLQHHIHHWPLGPFNLLTISPSSNFQGEKSTSNHSCLAWLDQQEPRSVIYVSFGTTTAMDNKQIKEIAIGLARSRQKFIWVLRDADTGDVYSSRDARRMELPKGYDKMMGQRGLVITEWAPQLKILNHPATGGFMTHCGWNSCMESITAGVPVAAWPMHSDQPKNTVLMTAVLRVGVVVREWGQGSGEVVVAAEAVEDAVRRLMVSEEGATMRRTAERLGDAVRQSVLDGGESRRELEAFVAHIRR